MSIAGGLENAVQAAVEVGCECLQIFVKNQRQWTAPELTADQIARFKHAVRQSGVRPVVAHATYLINLASPDDATWRRSINALTDELLRCEALGIRALVVHPGAHVGEGLDTGIARIVSALDEIHQRTGSLRARLALETTAGQGTAIGAEVAEIGRILETVQHPRRLRVCVDTCHVFAAGYDIRKPEAYASLIEELRTHVGLGNISCIHLNDSKRACGSRVDRHDHVGQGKIGKAGLARVVNDTHLATIPKILETPKGTDGRGTDLDRANLKRLRKWIAEDAA
ncbi:MAG: deoxyribonuclease IV [bacterium]|nr:deoxyribonuclease IV [bacterium]